MKDPRYRTRTQALILAGGQGERLFPLTVSRPKPAIPFGGVFRTLDFTLSNCLNSKLDQVALLTQYRHEELHSYVQRGWVPLWEEFSNATQPLMCLPPETGKRYRGTADAVFQNLTVIQSNRPEHVLVLGGDHIYQMDYRELLSQHVETQADATIATIEHPVQDASHFGVVEVDNDFRVTGFQEKPRRPRTLPSLPDRALVSMGVYAFKTDVLIRTLVENCEQGSGYDFGHHIIPSLIGPARVYAYDFRDEANDSPRYWRDIGTLDSYYAASMDLVRPGSRFKPYSNDHDPSQITHHSVAEGNGGLCLAPPRVHSTAHVSCSVLAPGVRIEAGAQVKDSVLMPGAQVGRGAALRRVIIEEGVHIPAEFRIGWNHKEDRKHYTLSPSGIVVVSQTPNKATAVVRFKTVSQAGKQVTVACGSNPAFGI